MKTVFVLTKSWKNLDEKYSRGIFLEYLLDLRLPHHLPKSGEMKIIFLKQTQKILVPLFSVAACFYSFSYFSFARS